MNNEALDTLIENALHECERFAPRTRPNHRPWTAEETVFLRKNAGVLTDMEIAERLGRSRAAVKVRRVRALLPSRHAHPDFVAASVAAKMLGIDEHKVCSWIDSGLLAGEIYEKQNTSGRCASGRYMRRVRLVTLKRFITRPHHWIYFDPRGVVDADLQRLVLCAWERWGDEWWTARQVADFHGVDVTWVAQKLRQGKIPGLQARNLGGRHPDAAWSYWFIRRSDAIRARFLDARESALERAAEEVWSERADAFILRAKADGMGWTEIGVRMGWRPAKVSYRWRMLHLTPSPSPKNGEGG